MEHNDDHAPSWPTSDDGYNCTVRSECGHDPIRLNIQPPIYLTSLPRVGHYGMCWCDDERERLTTAVDYDAVVVLHLVEQASKNDSYGKGPDGT